MKMLKLFPWFPDAWNSYNQCRSALWWPLSFLLLTPLAVLIFFGVIIPFGLNHLGLITFNHSFLNYPYLLLVAGLIFCAIFPFLDGLYQLIKTHLAHQPINENTGFLNLLQSQNMGRAVGPVFIVILLLEALSSQFKPLNLLVIMAYALTIFTPVLLIQDSRAPWYKAIESVQFTLQHKKIIAKIWALRFLIICSLIVPWILVSLCGSHPALKVVMLLLAIPAFIYNLVALLPFYFFYPAFVYEQMKSTPKAAY